jgi:hypothetical protein
MFIQILQVILILAMFIVIRWFAWKVTEVWGLPEWLQYKPWNCKLCLTFWSLIVSYLAIGLIFHLPITLFGGIALAIMNALAMWIDQKNKTIRIEDL